MNLCIKFTSLSSNPAAANSKPEPKKRRDPIIQPIWNMEIFGQPTSALPEKNGVPKKHPLGFGGFFSEVTFLQAQCHLAWRSWCHSCISDESWGEFWSIFFRQKNMGETGFFQRKTLGSVIMVFELRVNFSWIIHPPMSHSLLILWVWILYSWFSYVCTIHFYAGHTPSFMVHN